MLLLSLAHRVVAPPSRDFWHLVSVESLALGDVDLELLHALVFAQVLVPLVDNLDWVARLDHGSVHELHELCARDHVGPVARNEHENDVILAVRALTRRASRVKTDERSAWQSWMPRARDFDSPPFEA